MDNKYRSTAPYRKILRFISQSSSLPVHSTDEVIARTILEHANRMHELTIEDIANESMTSISSASRFFVKMGFHDFKDFKECALEYFSQIDKMRLKSALKNYGNMSVDEFSDVVYHSAAQNLEFTRNNFDSNKIQEIVYLLKSKKNIWFVGDTKELNTAKVLQLDLLVNQYGAYMLNINDFKEDLLHINQLQDSVFVFFNVFEKWYGKEMLYMTELLNGQNIPCVLFTQDISLSLPENNMTYYYGKPGSMNAGYYSLEYLCKVISECIYLLD